MEHTFKTRLVAGGAQVETKAQIDFTGVSQDDLQKLALRSVVIEQQAIYRTSGKIPATDNIKVQELLTRTRTPFVPTPENMLAKASKMSVEEQQALLKKLMDSLKTQKK